MLQVLSIFGASAVAMLTSALTYSGGQVTFEAADEVAIDTGISNALSNLWAGFQFILPYLGVALGIVLVIGVVMFLVRRAGR